MKDKESLVNILGDVRDLKRVSKQAQRPRQGPARPAHDARPQSGAGSADADKVGKLTHPGAAVDPSIELVNDNTPQISRIQIDLLVNSLCQ